MSRYLTPLPGLLARAIERALAAAADLDPGAGEHLDRLAGRCIRVRLERLGIDLFFTGADGRVRVRAESGREADATISAPPSALASLALSENGGRDVRVEGSAGAAQALERLLRSLDPDLETLLVRHLGVIPGHQVYRVLADAAGAGRHLAATAADQAAHYLREESAELVRPHEMRAFVREVDDLREAADRLQVRLARRTAS